MTTRFGTSCQGAILLSNFFFFFFFKADPEGFFFQQFQTGDDTKAGEGLTFIVLYVKGTLWVNYLLPRGRTYLAEFEVFPTLTGNV